jgi:hypothetical protein
VAEHYLLVTDPPHRDADQETAAKCLGWSVAEVRARLPHPAPEIWHAELDADGARDKAKLLIGAGFKMALVRGQVLAAVPAADPVSAISLSDGGFSLATSSGTLEVPREAHVVAVVAHPKEVLPETLHPGEDEVPAALFVDVYVQAGKRWRAGRLEATHVEFSGLGVLKQATAAANVRIITDELEARFSGVRPLRPRLPPRIPHGADGEVAAGVYESRLNRSREAHSKRARYSCRSNLPKPCTSTAATLPLRFTWKLTKSSPRYLSRQVARNVL